MGIKGLPNYLTRYAESSVRSYKLSNCRGWKVAIDTSLLVNQLIRAARSGGNETLNDDGEITTHLLGVCSKIIGFLNYGIIPIFVFDGKSPAYKQVTREERDRVCRKAEEACEKLIKEESEKVSSMSPDINDDEEPITAIPNTQEFYKQHSRAYRASSCDYTKLRILFDLLGVPYIRAPEEADVVCAWLVVKKLVKGPATEDSDMLTLGSNYLFKNMLSSINSGQDMTLISLRKAKKALGVNMEGFIDTCILLGTDGNINLKNVGPVKVHTSIEQGLSLEEIQEKYRSNYTNDEEYQATVANMAVMKDYFTTAVSKLDDEFTVTEDQLSFRQCQRENAIDFLVTANGVDLAQAISRVDYIVSFYKKLGIDRENNSDVYKSSGKLATTSLDDMYTF